MFLLAYSQESTGAETRTESSPAVGDQMHELAAVSKAHGKQDRDKHEEGAYAA